MPEIIEEHDDPRISKYLGLKGSNIDSFIIGEGLKVIRKQNQQIGLEEILVSQKTYEANIEVFNEFRCPIYIAKDSFLSNHVGYKYHQGIFGYSRAPGFLNPRNIKSNVLILDNLDNAENVGALIRSATGLGFNNILFSHQTASPYLKRSIRVSMGNVFFAHLYRSSNLVSDIKNLIDSGIPIYAAANSNHSLNYKELKNDKAVGIIIGNEGNGISEEVISTASKVIKIPITNEVEHLNAAAAGAILMSHFSKI